MRSLNHFRLARYSHAHRGLKFKSLVKACVWCPRKQFIWNQGPAQVQSQVYELSLSGPGYISPFTDKSSLPLPIRSLDLSKCQRLPACILECVWPNAVLLQMSPRLPSVRTGAKCRPSRLGFLLRHYIATESVPSRPFFFLVLLLLLKNQK